MLKKNDAKKVKQNDDPDWPPYETIGLPLRTHTNSVWPILTSKTIGLPSGVINASHKMSYDVSVPSYLPLGYTYYATHFYDNDVLETVYWKQGRRVSRAQWPLGNSYYGLPHELLYGHRMA